ncbi:serine hydrolase [Micromonospora zhanjiangensis]|uniref:Serine hydrolase n=1 Tax=Micromonospora zhanjiangensis TaxID=1522057 RepID=A0ABV8KMC8_9ACTN
MRDRGSAAAERVDRVFARVGATGHLRAVDLADGRELAVRADEPVVLASVFKILLVLEFARQAAAGQVDPTERMTVRAVDRLGGWGTGGCADDAEVSLRDLAYFAMSVSDNTAADLLLRRIGGRELLVLLAAELGLTGLRVIGGPRQLVESMLADVGARDEAEFARIFPTLSPERVRELSIYDPERTTSGTAREITRLLELIWTDRAGPTSACELVRALMARQVSRTRLASGFPPGVRVAAKSGTLPQLQMEAGVAEFPAGERYALAVFARVDRPGARPVDVDLAIGEAARLAVDTLRARP